MSKAKKKESVFCYSCDMLCDVSFSREEDKQHVSFCPFCGEEVEREEDDESDTEGTEQDDDWG